MHPYPDVCPDKTLITGLQNSVKIMTRKHQFYLKWYVGWGIANTIMSTLYNNHPCSPGR